MAEQIQISDQVTVGAQPSESEIEALAQRGFRSVVNFCTEGEDDQSLSPDAEGEKVKAAGMDYLHIPVSMTSMEAQTVDRFRERYASLPKPIFAHCKSGKRSGAMVMMTMAVQQGMTGEQVLQKAQGMGFECDKPELMQFVKDYVDKHTKKP